LLYRFSEDVNLNGTLFHWYYDGWDRVLRPWTQSPTLVVTPGYSSRYGVEVRCLSFPGCGGLHLADVTVPCPPVPTPFPETIRFVSPNTLTWDTEALRVVDSLVGDLAALRTGGFSASVLGCSEDQAVQYFAYQSDPPLGVGWYFLVRTGGYAPACVRSWSTGSPAEAPGPGGGRDSAIPLDPDSCAD
jgi:hypothetical protein